MSDVVNRMLVSIICAGFAWSSGLIFQWIRSRSSDLKALRKYERLRAKVEVLSRLTGITLNDMSDTTLTQRQQVLVRNELRSVLEELEHEEEVAGRTPLRLGDLLRPLRIGPSFSIWQTLTKSFFYAVSFLTLCVTFLFLAVFLFPVSPPPGGQATPDLEFGGVICLAFPCLVLTLLSYWVARRAHRGSTVTAEIVKERADSA